jgi:hypothetical protein
VWHKPDWAFIEEGLPVPPRGHSSRYEPNVLGEYALTLGDGYMIHGTLYQRLIGSPVTHGCVRILDEDLEVVYKTLPVGAKSVYLLKPGDERTIIYKYKAGFLTIIIVFSLLLIFSAVRYVFALNAVKATIREQNSNYTDENTAEPGWNDPEIRKMKKEVYWLEQTNFACQIRLYQSWF